jgi:long-chain acyl-CoA synthetase
VDTLLDLLDDAVRRFGDRPAVAERDEHETHDRWSYRELERRSRLAAWRLRALGLAPGDRLLTLSPSTPALPAVIFGAMRARLVLVPLDLRMSPGAVAGVVGASGARHLALGTGRDAPDPAAAGLGDFPTTTLEALVAEPDEDVPADWEARLAAWPRPESSEIWELIFTSGTTGTPKGVMLAHDNVLAGVRSFHAMVPPMDHRIVSLLPLSHLLEQSVGLLYAASVGADILYVRSRNPRVVFAALREHRVTSMVVVPQVLDLFWAAIEREVDRRGRTRAFGLLRQVARRLPAALRRRLFGSVHRQLGGSFRLFVSSGAFLPPAVQQAWEDLGVVVLQGYGTTETGSGTCTTLDDHGIGTVGRPAAGLAMRLASDGEIQFRGPSLFKGYWQDEAATAAAFTPDGWYRTGDIGRLDDAGRLVFSGRTKNIIVLPNGFNVYPEDIENALQVAGIRESVVIETEPGRIEAIVLPPGRGPAGAAADGRAEDDTAVLAASIGATVKAANATLGVSQRIAGWRLWPGDDFPRTHTLKVRRDPVRSRRTRPSPGRVRSRRRRRSTRSIGRAHG